jgi:4-hydroxybenzoate polyprenyltransferase
MSDTAKPEFSWLAWAQLVRLPTVFTILADVAAAFLLVSHGPEPISRFVCVLFAGVALYWAGMILNDVFDIDQDRKQRSGRPLPAGDVSISAARRVGWGLLFVGVLAATMSGFLPDMTSVDEVPVASTWLPGMIAAILAIMIVAYDGPLKKTPLAPYAMGSCRFLSFLLGASPALVADGGPMFPTFLIAIALGFGVYVAGITTIARDEAIGGHSPRLNTGMLLLIIGTLILAFAPQTAPGNFAWRFSPRGTFPVLIGLIAFPVIMRGLRLFRSPTPKQIQNMIRAGVLTIIPLAASFALLGAGRFWGLAIFALVVPAILVSLRMRVT